MGSSRQHHEIDGTIPLLQMRLRGIRTLTQGHLGLGTQGVLTPDLGFPQFTMRPSATHSSLRMDVLQVFSKLKTPFPFFVLLMFWFQSQEPPVHQCLFLRLDLSSIVCTFMECGASARHWVRGWRSGGIPVQLLKKTAEEVAAGLK